MDIKNLSAQVSKLAHNILDVRFRAIDNILFKLSVNLIELNQVCANTKICKYCIEWFDNGSNREKFHSVLQLILKICDLNNPQFIEYFLDKHLPSYLHKLTTKYQLNHNELQIIQQIISKLVSTPNYNQNKENINTNPQKHDISSFAPSSQDTESENNDNAFDENDWRFPYIPLIRSDIEYLYDISLRLKVQNISICEYAMLQLSYLTLYHFPPEILLQSDTHLLPSLLIVLNGDNNYLIQQCIALFIKFIQRIINSLHLRCDPSIITHPSSKYIRHQYTNDDDYQYPNDFSLELINNRYSNIENTNHDQFRTKNALACISIRDMIYKLLDVLIHKQLLNNFNKYQALKLLDAIGQFMVKINDIPMILYTINLFKDYIESVDLDNVCFEDIFMVQIIEFIMKCLKLCPLKYISNEHIGPFINVFLCRFVCNITFCSIYDELRNDIISILQHLDACMNHKIEYVDHVLKAMDTLEDPQHTQRMSILELRSTFIALPFNLKCVKSVIECILAKTDGNRECISMLLMSPSSHIINECLQVIITCLHNRNTVPNALVSIDIIYILLTIIPKHDKIQAKVHKILELLYTKCNNNDILEIFQKLYPLLSLYLINTSFQSIVNMISETADSKPYFYPIINQLRLCFHSDAKIRSVSHRKITDLYIDSVIRKTESEEKLNKPTNHHETHRIYDLQHERAKIDELIRISKYDLFHYDDIQKYAIKYQEKKRNASDFISSSFEVDDIHKIVSILSNKTLEDTLKVTAADQLLLIFRRNKQFWYILRNKELLTILIKNILRTNNDAFIMALLEIFKLRFETTLCLDEIDCNIAEYEQILAALLPTMFMPNTKIRYLFSCICALIVFHPMLLLSQSSRNRKNVQKEKESYAPKLLLINKDNIGYIWIPKFISSYVYLLCPQHKIRWTSHYTRAFEHIVDIRNDTKIDHNQLYSQNQHVKDMIHQHLQIKNKAEYKEQQKTQIVDKILSALTNCKSHSDFIEIIHRIMSTFTFSDFLDRFCSEPRFYAMLERILSVVPLSPNDDRVFVVVIKCITVLIKSDTFVTLMRKQQFDNDEHTMEAPIQLLLKLNGFINDIYIKYMDDIPPSYTLSTVRDDEEKQSEKERLLSTDLIPTKAHAIAEIFNLFDAFIIFVSKHNFMDKNDQYKETLNNILQCILKQLSINPISYQHIVPVNGLIADNIRLQSALKSLLSILTMTTSIASNELMVEQYDHILTLILDISSRNKTPHSFCFKNDFKIAMVCLDFMLEHFTTDTHQIYEHHKHLSWLIRFLSDRDCLARSLGYSVFASLIQSSSSSNTSAISIESTYPSSLKLILLKNKDFIDYMFGSIKTSASSLVRIYAIDCLRMTLNLYMNYKHKDTMEKEEQKSVESDDNDEEEALTELMETHVLKRISQDIDVTKLLHDVTGNAAYFKSVCYLLKTLILCDVGNFRNIPFEAMHFARFRYLLQYNQYKLRYNEHIKVLNIPDYLKSESVLNASWIQSEGALHSIQSAVSVLDIFNVVLHGIMKEEKQKKNGTHSIYRSMTAKGKSAFITSLMQANCLQYVFDLLQSIVTNTEWESISSIFRFFTYLSKAKPNLLREILLKTDGNQDKGARKHVEGWCSNFILKQISACLSAYNEEESDDSSILSICKLLFELSSTFEINPDEFTASYYRRYAVKSENPSVSSPDLLIIINYFMAKIVQQTELLDYDKKELPHLLSEYYETLTMMLSVSRMSKIICCYHCDIGDFVQFITNRLSQTMALFILRGLRSPKHNKAKTLNISVSIETICGEMIRVLRLIQNILYVAPSEIKRQFASCNLGELLMKLYPSTLYKNKLIYELHDMLLSVFVNFVAHCEEAKYIISQNGFLIKILKQAFDAKTRISSYLLCFDIMDSMMLSMDGINVLIKNNYLLQKSVQFISCTKNRKHRKRICCIKLLRNLSMQSVGQTFLIKYFLPKKVDQMVQWIDATNGHDDEEFINVCSGYLRNLGFITQFKLAFANHTSLIMKIFDILLKETEYKDEDKEGIAIDITDIETRLSLITLLWTLIHKNNKNMAFIRHLPSPSLMPLIQSITKLNKQTKWDKKSNHYSKILLNSLLDRCKLVNKLLLGL